MHCYIVRVYREEPDAPQAVVGIVEDVERKASRSFAGIDELWDILKPGSEEDHGGAARRTGKGPSPVNRPNHTTVPNGRHKGGRT